MSTKEVNIEHQDGPPWTIIGRFSTFDEADQRRLELAMEEDLQVKIRWASLRDDFVVKTRIDPIIALEEGRRLQREQKKRRKEKLNKKRRKK